MSIRNRVVIRRWCFRRLRVLVSVDRVLVSRLGIRVVLGLVLVVRCLSRLSSPAVLLRSCTVSVRCLRVCLRKVIRLLIVFFPLGWVGVGRSRELYIVYGRLLMSAVVSRIVRLCKRVRDVVCMVVLVDRYVLRVLVVRTIVVVRRRLILYYRIYVLR